MGENPEKNRQAAVNFRVFFAFFLVLMILLVVLLTCLLELGIHPSPLPELPAGPQTVGLGTMPTPSTAVGPGAMSKPSTAAMGPGSMPTPSTAVVGPGAMPTPSTAAVGPGAMPKPSTAVGPGANVSSCPSQANNLIAFPTANGNDNVTLDHGIRYILDRNVTINTLRITNSASLTVVDNGTAILLKTKYILIESQGSLLIGSEDCPHSSPLEIMLYGKSTDPEQIPQFGHKFIGVAPTATIDIHGPWKLAWTLLNATILPGGVNIIVNLADEADSWLVGDQIVIASSDYDMNHAEVFQLLPCVSCTKTQIMISGPVLYQHIGTTGSDGVDMRAEVGLLTRSIKIYGEVQPSCYGANQCEYFDYDTFGGTTHVLHGVKLARFEGIEVYHMGQQVLGRYPIHFHRVFESYGNYARQLSIHNCFSRCVTVHAAIGLLVEDVVGYDTLGHCFFTEDGIESNNVFRHNLGLVTRYGSLLPSDRNDEMCLGLTANPKNYLPNPDNDCKGAATFFISRPDNILIDNAAAGSVEIGFFYLFYRIPTGPSNGLLPPFDGERSPMSISSGNRAHSNQKAGLFLDRGVKVDAPSNIDPRDLLALTDLERFQPHVAKNLSLPRSPAHIENFTSYMNSMGLFVRGGDIWISNSRFSDNDVAVMMASSVSLPYDQGSHQELMNSTIVGKSQNNLGWNNRSVPCVGFQIRDGPVVIGGNNFFNFPSTVNRSSYAVGFYPNNTGQNSPANVVGLNNFYNVSQKLSFGEVGSYYGSYNSDGDLTQIVFDESGSVTGSSGSYVVRPDNPIMNDTTCQFKDGLKYCNAAYGQLFVNVSSKSISFVIEDRSLNNSADKLILEGVDKTDPNHPTTTQFQPVLIANHTYRINWSNGPAPQSLNLSMHNFDQYSFLMLEICYPSNTSFNASRLLLNQAIDPVTLAAVDVVSMTTVVAMNPSYSSLLTPTPNEAQYFWNSTTSLLTVKLQALWLRVGYNYCADDGCHYLNIVANVSTPGEYHCN